MAAINMTNPQFQQALSEGKTILIDYWAPWCSYCRRIGPAYEKISEEYGDKIIVDEEVQLAQQEKIGVIPTLVLYKDGKRLHSVVAPESKAAINAFLKENLGL